MTTPESPQTMALKRIDVAHLCLEALATHVKGMPNYHPLVSNVEGALKAINLELETLIVST